MTLFRKTAFGAAFIAGSAALFLVGFAGGLGGCRTVSPAVGVWTGEPTGWAKAVTDVAKENGGSAEARASVTLISDGTGFMKIPFFPEQAIGWKEKSGKVTLILSDGNEQSKRENKEDSESESEPSTVIGTLSEDGDAMSVDFGITTLNLHRQGK